MKLKRRIVIATLVLVPIGWAWGQTEPLDLFADEPQLADGFIRIGSWNLRHINVEGDADHFLEGQTEEEDFEILTKTFAKAIEDLGLDLVAVSEHQPRSGEPNRLNQIRDALNGGGQGPWRADASQIVYDNPNSFFSNLQLAVLWNSDKVTIDPAVLPGLRESQLKGGKDEIHRPNGEEHVRQAIHGEIEVVGPWSEYADYGPFSASCSSSGRCRESRIQTEELRN